MKVVGNHKYRCNNSSPRICVRTTMLSSYFNEKFLRFHLQDKHNASYFPKCRVDTWPTMAKLRIIFEIGKSIWSKTQKIFWNHQIPHIPPIFISSEALCTIMNIQTEQRWSKLVWFGLYIWPPNPIYMAGQKKKSTHYFLFLNYGLNTEFEHKRGQ